MVLVGVVVEALDLGGESQDGARAAGGELVLGADDRHDLAEGVL
jgi:hypothetical protein